MSLRTRSRSTKETPQPPTHTHRVVKSQPHEEEEEEEEEVEEEKSLIERKNSSLPPPPPPTLPQQALSRALDGTAHLANLLPTGTLLAFQILTPVFTNNGACDSATRPMTQLLLLLLAASCSLACFTDTFRSPDGQLYYGFATPRGMRLFDYPAAAAAAMPDLSKYKLRVIDFVHAVLSVLVFAAVALRDKNVLSCFYPKPEHETQEVLDVVPLVIGLICSSLFVIFPTRRHGIGYPVTNGK